MQRKSTPLRCQDHGLSASELARRLGRKLRYLRAQSGYTQSELSKNLGMGRAYISKLERGRVMPRYFTLVRLAACLGVAPAELMRVEIGAKSNGPNEPQKAHS
jgi:transcriptional regulator with XRE-family HTH domain